jgi:hypothetical protein
VSTLRLSGLCIAQPDASLNARRTFGVGRLGRQVVGEIVFIFGAPADGVAGAQRVTDLVGMTSACARMPTVG